MSRPLVYRPDPKLDLVFERVVDVSPGLVWAAWTQPRHLMKWFTPAPWRTVACTIDLRPGGLFHTVMQSPDGKKYPNTGCYLEVIQGKRLVWTDALGSGYRPVARSSIDSSAWELGGFTAVISLAARGKGTRYRAVAIHSSVAARRKHEAMGFHQGWGAALDQLVALMQKRPARRR